ncbi:hypothetical protein KUCAC02_005929 [Chaenocephalus aceratus]|uniref:Uncharacterized protein n=1 Tax=Chaenocephalus aceratus TaxID=36190 RepID=A0ACB9WPR5_CHAAC|nr:hypothetical protein KUCAC02_005929 [Chaenocephalus aceratus]
MGVKYTPIAEYFPVKDLDLWSRDGVTEPTPSPVVHRRSPPARRVTPRVIVKGEVAKSPQPDPSKWTVIGQGRKRSQHDEPEQSIDALQPAGTVQQEELEESYFPLTPVWFSSAMLVEMDKISPSHLPGPDECTPPSPKRQKKAKMAPKQRASASKRTLAMRQVVVVFFFFKGEAAPMVVEVILRPPTSTGTVAVEQQVEPFPGLEPSPGVEPLASVEPSLSVELSPSNEPSLGVMVDVDDNGWRTGQGGHYAVVDSHARSASGMRDGEGRSVVLYFRGLEHVFEYIWTFAAFLKKSQKQFEIAGVRVTHIGPIESSNLSLGSKSDSQNDRD